MCNMFLISLVFKNVPYLKSEAGPQAVYSTDSELLIRWIKVIDSEHKHSLCKYRLFGCKYVLNIGCSDGKKKHRPNEMSTVCHKTWHSGHSGLKDKMCAALLLCGYVTELHAL